MLRYTLHQAVIKSSIDGDLVAHSQELDDSLECRFPGELA